MGNMKSKGNKIMRILKIAVILTIAFYMRAPIAWGLFWVARGLIAVANVLTTF
jgi:hypothetical protein